MRERVMWDEEGVWMWRCGSGVWRKWRGGGTEKQTSMEGRDNEEGRGRKGGWGDGSG